MGLELDAHTLEKIIRFAKSHFGVVIQKHQLAGLKRHLERSFKRFAYEDCSLYFAELIDSEGDSELMLDFVDAITVGESYFFRGKDQIDFLYNKYFPDLIRSRLLNNQKFIRVWSAGSSNGQELYTLAMMLDELIPSQLGWSFYLLGTDINRESLQRARDGLFLSASFRVMEEPRLSRYFEEKGSCRQLKDFIRKQATFNYLNLMAENYEAEISTASQFDLILCRNVFIYFEHDEAKEVLKRLLKCLAPGGILLLGPSDIIHDRPDGAKVLMEGDLVYYMCENEEPVSSPAAIKAPSFKKPEPPEALRAPSVKTPSVQKKSALAVTDFSDEITKLKSLQESAQWLELVDQADICFKQVHSSVVLQLKALALASLGRLDEALLVCDQALDINPLDEKVFYILGLLNTSFENFDAAEKFFKKSLFLDRNFIEAHYQLGLLYACMGKEAKSKKSFNNVVKTIDSVTDPTRGLFDLPSVSLESLKESLSDNEL